MSEENRWGENLPETGGNAPKEGNALNTYGNTDTGSATGSGMDHIETVQEEKTDSDRRTSEVNFTMEKPLTHPYSAGRRMQAMPETHRMAVWLRKNRNTDIMKCISLRQEIMQEEAYRPRNHKNPEHPVEMGITVLAKKQRQQWLWL